MINIKDISKKTGFSITTVSKALNNYPDIKKETKDIILKTCKEMNYTPNAIGRSLSMKKTYTIGVVFQEETNLGLTHPFFAELLDQFKKEIEKKGYDILLIGNKIGRYIHSYLSHCQQKSVDGIIMLSSFPENDQIQELINSDIPKVLMQAKVDDANCFVSDNIGAISKAVYYLYERGHRKIATIHGDLQTNDGNERHLGYLKAMEELKIEINGKYIFDGSSYTFEEGRTAANKIFSLKDRPTALIASSDTLAIGAMQELTNLGLKVPDDISIIGFDNIKLSEMIVPGLTTISQDKFQMAKLATESLMEQIEKKRSDKKLKIIPTKFIERQSVKKI